MALVWDINWPCHVVSLPHSIAIGSLSELPEWTRQKLCGLYGLWKAHGIPSSAVTGLHRLYDECQRHIVERACGVGDPGILLANTTCAVTFGVKVNNRRRRQGRKKRKSAPGVGSGVAPVSCAQQKGEQEEITVETKIPGGGMGEAGQILPDE